MVDLIIVGGGVAGLMAAGQTAANGVKVLLLEKMEKPARKLRITGKGRCNITNARNLEEFLQKIPRGAEFVRPSLQSFDYRSTINLLKQIGVSTVIERGNRVFPEHGRAWDVAEALIDWVMSVGAEIRCNSEVETIFTTKSQFQVNLKNGESLNANQLLIATGGVSYPSTGSTGDGYRMAHHFGHTIIPIRPSLVPLDIGATEQYKKVELRNIAARLVVDNVMIAEEFGDVDFTDRALSGAAIIQLSSMAVDSIINGNKVIVELDMKPALSHEKLCNRIRREIEQMPTASYRILLQKLIPAPLFRKAIEQSGISKARLITELSEQEISDIAATLKSVKFQILDYRPFTEAIITAGGVSLDEVNSQTMESLLIPNLYFAGELLDIDGDTGGFNIQLAFSTANTAARAIVNRKSK